MPGAPGPAVPAEPAVERPLALAAAQRRRVPRVPFVLQGRCVGSVATAELGALQALAQALRTPGLAVVERGVTLHAADAAAVQAVLAPLNAALRQQGLVRAWRDEAFALLDPDEGTRLGALERAACRFWGLLTLGAHANGCVLDAQGRPTHLWIARRSDTKATDPGLRDNLVGGGVPDGQSPAEALVREGWEEAGLDASAMAAARPAAVLRLHRDIAEGLQLEDLHAFDLPLPPGQVPANQDGEVAGFACLPVAEAVACALGEGPGPAMTVDAALVTLDFARRHDLWPAGWPEARRAALVQALQGLARG